MTSPLDEIFRKMLNDRAIFDYGKNDVGCLIGRKDVPRLRQLLECKDPIEPDEFKTKLDRFKAEVRQAVDSKKRQSSSLPKEKPPRELQEAMRLGETLLRKLDDSLPLVRRIFGLLDDYGALHCRLPNMEDYGRVVENQQRTAVEQYFGYQIDKASPWQREPLRRMLNYIEEGYERGLRPDELGFLVRKVGSLTCLTEV